MLALAPWVAVLSRCHPSCRPFESANPETAAGDVLPVHDPGHFAIDPDLFHVVAATVAGVSLDQQRRPSSIDTGTPSLFQGPVLPTMTCKTTNMPSTVRPHSDRKSTRLNSS